MSSSDDEAPEAVPMAVAKSKALASRESEKQAHQHAKLAQKRKRQPQAAKPEELPSDILEAVAAAHQAQGKNSTEDNEEQLEEQEPVAKTKPAGVRPTHSRKFGTIVVSTLDEAPQEKLTDEAKSFWERRTAPQRKRTKVVVESTGRKSRKK
ncbi:unnamed protein product [Aphanomyces euteiches]|uniref:Uncharacterized protein n=1 Tax=Aphanomyces euteiches TaxID=100861 RepID=A0A6G0WCU1_9STRA|nr:hypothetical protein Ae201684_016369 [Aphanomyces euteiches]KAH9079936.1 hypothetical protein Ae201684P_007644 [Aphanomyces euteiches]KAH9133633.1 hypothetical protein AeRB84_020295 [Aphanomyces euteiches]